MLVGLLGRGTGVLFDEAVPVDVMISVELSLPAAEDFSPPSNKPLGWFTAISELKLTKLVADDLLSLPVVSVAIVSVFRSWFIVSRAFLNSNSRTAILSSWNLF